MEWDILHWGQFYTILMIGFALGMDAFSMGVGMGLLGIRLLTIAKISSVIGLFHFIMPLLGIVIGLFLSSAVGSIASFIGGMILCFLGANMLWSGFFPQEIHRTFQPRGLGLFLIALSVSMDALSAGFSFGLFEVNVLLAVMIFGFMGMILTGAGLWLGKHVGHRLGGYGEVLGGSILMAFGIKFLL